MQIVIKIPEEKYNLIKNKMYCGVYDAEVYKAISNGAPLPKGHGRLIDADRVIREAIERVKYPANHKYMECVVAHVKLAPTIIEADAPKRRKGTPLEENDSGYNCENWIP